MTENTFDNSFSGTLWPEADPEHPGQALDGVMRGNFTGPDNKDGLRLAAQKTPSGSWALQVQRPPEGREKKARVLFVGVLSKSGTRNPDAPVLLGYLKPVNGEKEDAKPVAIAGFSKNHDFRGEYVQVVKSTIEQAPLKLNL